MDHIEIIVVPMVEDICGNLESTHDHEKATHWCAYAKRETPSSSEPFEISGDKLSSNQEEILDHAADLARLHHAPISIL